MNIIAVRLSLQIPEDSLKSSTTKYVIIKQMHYIEKSILRVLTVKGILRIDLKIIWRGRESQAGSSKPDFNNKVRISLREMRESNYP